MLAVKLKKIIFFSMVGLFCSSGLFASAAAANILELISAAHTTNPNPPYSGVVPPVKIFPQLYTGQSITSLEFGLTFMLPSGTGTVVNLTTNPTMLSAIQSVLATDSVIVLLALAPGATVTAATLTFYNGSTKAYIAEQIVPIGGSLALSTFNHLQCAASTSMGTGTPAAPAQTTPANSPIFLAPQAFLIPAAITVYGALPPVPTPTTTFTGLTTNQQFNNLAFLINFSGTVQSYVWPSATNYSAINTAVSAGTTVNITIKTYLNSSSAWVSDISYGGLTGTSPDLAQPLYVYSSSQFPGDTVTAQVSPSATLLSTSLAYVIYGGAVNSYTNFSLGSATASAPSQTVQIVPQPAAVKPKTKLPPAAAKNSYSALIVTDSTPKGTVGTEIFSSMSISGAAASPAPTLIYANTMSAFGVGLTYATNATINFAMPLSSLAVPSTTGLYVKIDFIEAANVSTYPNISYIPGYSNYFSSTTSATDFANTVIIMLVDASGAVYGAVGYSSPLTSTYMPTSYQVAVNRAASSTAQLVNTGQILVSGANAASGVNIIQGGSSTQSVQPMPSTQKADQTIVPSAGNSLTIFAFNPIFSSPNTYSRFFLTQSQLDLVNTTLLSANVILGFNVQSQPNALGFSCACTAYNGTTGQVIFDVAPTASLPNYYTIENTPNTAAVSFSSANNNWSLLGSATAITTNFSGYTGGDSESAWADNLLITSSNNLLTLANTNITYSYAQSGGTFMQANGMQNNPSYVEFISPAL